MSFSDNLLAAIEAKWTEGVGSLFYLDDYVYFGVVGNDDDLFL